MGGYVWNILQPEIVAPDYQFLVDQAGRNSPISSTIAEDYGEVKRHEWEFQHHTAFAYGVLSPDKQSELACVYINPSTKQGYEATVRLSFTKQAVESGLEPALEKAVRDWVKAKWPFKTVAFPGRDMPMTEWNALPAAGSTGGSR